MWEVPLTVVVWVGVVLFQAMMHFGIIPRRRQSLREAKDGKLLDMTDDFTEQFDTESEDEMDEDPRQFIKLLDQTGSEMVNVSVLVVVV
mmetsp:Transcript_1028/g.2548  ORF Transcript_1028/g.2548 Transcript_1028/m.2548 type:complete len:89 (-) Transcript_1028:149-415(-)